MRPFDDTAESSGDGASDQILGRWLTAHGQRDRVVVATKASRGSKEHPLSAEEIRTAAERSLKLQAHSAEFWDNPGGRVSTLLSNAKARVVGERAQPGDNEVERL